MMLGLLSQGGDDGDDGDDDSDDGDDLQTIAPFK